MNFESGLLEIRVQYHGTPTKSTLEKPKKKVPPSKVRRNRQRLAKFLEKTETQPNLPPVTFHERSEGVEGTLAPPLTTPPETCEKVTHDVSLQPDTNTFEADSIQAPSLSQI